MFCKQCGNKLKEGAAFCSKCGYKIVNQTNETVEISPPVTGTVCSKCGAPLKKGAAFCNACGASVIVQQPVQQRIVKNNNADGEKRFSVSDIPDTIIAVITLFVTHKIMRSNGTSITSDLYDAFWLWFLLMSIAEIPLSIITLIYHAVRSDGKGIKKDLITLLVGPPIGILISLISLHSVTGCVITIVVTIIIGGIIYLIKHLHTSDQ